MSERLFAWSMLASVGTHVAGLAAACVVSFNTPDLEPPPVPIEVVRVDPPPPPPPVQEPPKLKPVETLIPPKLIEREKPVLKQTPGVEKKQPVAEEAQLPALLDPTTPSLPAPPMEAPRVPELRGPIAGPPHPAPRSLAGNSLLPSPVVEPATSLEGKGIGRKLAATGDIGLTPGRGTKGEDRASGLSNAGPALPEAQGSAGAAGGGSTARAAGSPTEFARPLGGYQTTPRYPESARRQGIEGVALLTFEVLATGQVGRILVERSAGHPDLDRAALDAVRQWRFEPARRDKEAVTVWVTLPVRFELKAR